MEDFVGDWGHRHTTRIHLGQGNFQERGCQKLIWTPKNSTYICFGGGYPGNSINLFAYSRKQNQILITLSTSRNAD